MDAIIIFIYICLGMVAISAIGIAICMFMVYRNNWVHDQRTQLLAERLGEYDLYLDYHQMLYRFWIWDIEKLKKGK